MNFRQRCRRRLFAVRLTGALGCALLGGTILFSLSWLQGIPWLAPCLLGGGGAFALALLRRPPWAAPAREIDPGHDEDGLLRAFLGAGEEHPFAADLERQAASRAIRFRPLGELRPLALLAGAALFSVFWVQEAPAGSGGLSRGRGTGSAGVEHGGPGRPSKPAGAIPGKTSPRGGAAIRESVRNPARPRRRESGESGGGPAGGEWAQVPVRAMEGVSFRAGRDFGPYRVYLERYLRLKAGERK